MMPSNTQPLFKEAAQAYKAKQFAEALHLYEQIALKYGANVCSANIELCKKRLNGHDIAHNNMAEHAGSLPVTLEQQLANTQKLLEHYYTRCQELELQRINP